MYKRQLLIRTHLKIFHLFLVELPERDPSGHEDGGRLRYAEHLPAQVLKEGCQLGLAGGLAPTRTARQHQLVDTGRRRKTLGQGERDHVKKILAIFSLRNYV